jgi:hypothetical protein
MFIEERVDILKSRAVAATSGEPGDEPCPEITRGRVVPASVADAVTGTEGRGTENSCRKFVGGAGGHPGVQPGIGCATLRHAHPSFRPPPLLSDRPIPTNPLRRFRLRV